MQGESLRNPIRKVGPLGQDAVFGAVKTLTAAADIYAFGVILFEMLTGHCPFQTDSDLGYLQKHLHPKPEFTKAEEDQIPFFLRRLVLRCLDKRPQHRYPDVISLPNDLQGGRICIASRGLKDNGSPECSKTTRCRTA
ncbi:MAG: protein kinase [Candidatus Aminicenantes bacterium]|nr:protein kinase [Candidatus Aminicenantes bacterium]